MNKLVIVESPTKAKTLARMLDKSYKITASMGHVRDLPERALGVDIENNFAPLYVDTPRSKKIVSDLKKYAKDADEIYLAPDPDREGEAIAWHLHEVLKGKKKIPFYRVTFHEITSSAIHKAMENKGELDMNLVNSQQARRILDRIVGYKVSPLLWQKLEKGMSAGRVQSVALRLVVERERLIQNFVPEEYWVFSIIFETTNGLKIPCKLFKINAENFKIGSEQDANQLLDNIVNGEEPFISNITKQSKKRNAQAPFTTSTLQQTASSNLHMSPSNTMRYAQNLYEGIELGSKGSTGLITYMRTDSVTIAKEAQEAAKKFIQATYGDEFVPSKFNFYKNKSAAQEAHEAIRPTDVTRTPESIKEYLDDSQYKLYSLIWKRFVASQMTPAINNITTIEINVNGKDKNVYTFRNSISTPKFKGFSVVYPMTKSEDELSMNGALADSILKLKAEEKVKIDEIEKEQKFTEGPPHFSEASLIKELEENGIGRPSTYASIIKTILQRNYIEKEQGKLIPTTSGYNVNDFLVEHLDTLFNVKFTALMENELDKIESGELIWNEMLKNFYDKFAKWLDVAKTFDAPENDDAKGLLDLLGSVNYAPAQQVGKRTYDDQKFVKSVSDKFVKSGTISAKQFDALIKICAKYYSQLQNIPENLNSLISDAKNALENQEKIEASIEKIDYSIVFNNCQNIQWDEPPANNKKFFDEKKFFNSLKSQSEQGKNLSEKQLSVLKRIVQKYASSIENQDEIFKFLNISEETQPSSEALSQQNDEIKQYLAKLSGVTNWAEPTKKGRFVRDDKSFFESLSKQFESGKQLSDKQIVALKKLTEKY